MDVDEEVQVTMRKNMSSLTVCRRSRCIVCCLHVDEVGRMARSSWAQGVSCQVHGPLSIQLALVWTWLHEIEYYHRGM